MADKTFDVKISDDFYNKVMQMIVSSGVTAKEWFEKAVVLTEIHGLNVAAGDHNEDFSELDVHMTRIHELVANMIKREVYLKDNAVKLIEENLAEREVQLKNLKEELGTKKEDIASIATSLEKSNKEIVELHRQINEMRANNENNQSLIGALSRLVAEQEMQLEDLKEVFGTKEKEIVSFAVSLENSKMENAELHNHLDAMKATNENNQSLVREYKEKIDSLSWLVAEREVQLKDLNELFAASIENSTKENTELHKQISAMKANNESNQSLIGEYKEKINSLSELVSRLTNHQSKPQAKEENSLQKEERNSQKKKLKRLLKKHPKAKEQELAELLGVDSSYIIELRKEL